MAGETLTSMNIELALNADKLNRGIKTAEKNLKGFFKQLDGDMKQLEELENVVGNELPKALDRLTNSNEEFARSLQKGTDALSLQTNKAIHNNIPLTKDNFKGLAGAGNIAYKDISKVFNRYQGIKTIQAYSKELDKSIRQDGFSRKVREYEKNTKEWLETLADAKPIRDALNAKETQLKNLQRELDKAKLIVPKNNNQHLKQVKKINRLNRRITASTMEYEAYLSELQARFTDQSSYKNAMNWVRRSQKQGFDPIKLLEEIEKKGAVAEPYLQKYLDERDKYEKAKAKYESLANSGQATPADLKDWNLAKANFTKVRNKYGSFVEPALEANERYNVLIKAQAYDLAKTEVLEKQRLETQKKINKENEKLIGYKNKQLLQEAKQIDNNKKKLEQLRRQRYYAQRDILLATSGFGGTYFGTNVARSIIDRSAKYQNITAQKEAWAGLTPLQKSEFDIVADYTMNKNPMMSRTEATDATMAGMSSLGHWDFDILKTLIPAVSAYAQGSRSLGYSNDTVANIIKNYLGVAEARQQTTKPDAMLETFSTLWKIENVTGGKVTVKDFETILRNLGPGAPLISDAGLLNLVAFAEQIKVAGHGGGGGAGAGISTVGNLVKMLQLMATGKPTSLWAKKMLEPLRFDDGTAVLDQKAFSGNGAGGDGGLSVGLSKLWGIVETEFANKKGGGNNSLMGAGFTFKNEMWEDPVKAIYKLRDPILRETLKEENRATYYDKDVDFNNLTEKDKQKAINTFISKAGLSHRVVAAMTTFMNPAFQERMQHTVKSTGLIDDPMSLMEKQRVKGNWNVAVKDLDASFQRLAESMTPVVEDLAKITEGFSALLKTVAQFNEENPLLTRINALAFGLLTMAPGLSFFAMSIEGIVSALKRFGEAKLGIKALEDLQKNGGAKVADLSNVVDNREAIATKGGVVKWSRHKKSNLPQPQPTQPQPTPPTIIASSLQANGSAIDRFNKKLGSIVGVARKVVTKVGSFFFRLLPGIGTALLAFDLGTLFVNWIGQIEVNGRSMIDRLRSYADMARTEAIYNQENTKKAIENIDKTKGYNEIVQLQEELKEIKDRGQFFNDDYRLASNRTVGEVKENLEKFEIPATWKDFNSGETERLLESKQQYTHRDLNDKGNKLIFNSQTGEAVAVKTEKVVNELGESFKKLHKAMQGSIENIGSQKGKFGDNLLAQSREVATTTLIKDPEERKKILEEIREKIAKASEEERQAAIEHISKFKDEKNEHQVNTEGINFSKDFEKLVKEELVKSGNTIIAQDSEFIKKFLFDYFNETLKLIREGKDADVKSISSTLNSKLTDKNENIKHGDQFIPKNSQTARQMFPDKIGGGGMGFKSIHPAHQYWSDINAQLEEADASAESLMRGTGKRDIEWAKAEIVKKWQKGGFAPSKLTPEKSPWMKTKRGGLKEDNILWDKKDAFGRTALDYASKLQEAEVAKIATQAVQSMSQTYEDGISVFKQSMEFVNSSRLEELPSEIQSLNNTLAKALGNIGFGSEKNSKQILAQREKVEKAKNYAGIGVVAKLVGERASANKKLRDELNDLSIKENLSTASQALYDHQKALQKLNETYDEYLKLLQKARETAEQDKNLSENERTKKLQDIADKEKALQEQRLEEQRNLNNQYNLQNKTAGEELVRQWTDLSKMLDDMQTQMMEGFITATEDWLDGNLDSWKEYAYNLGRLFRNQLLKAGFAPLLEQLTGFMRLGVSSFAGDAGEYKNSSDALARQRPSSIFGINVKGVADTIKGWFTSTPSESSTPVTTVDTTSTDAQGAQQVADQAKAQVATSTMELGGFWGSFKNVLTNVGNSLSSLGNSFMEFISNPLQSLSSAFVNACSYLGNAVISLFASMGGSGKTSYLKTFIGGAIGGAINWMGSAISGSFSNNEIVTPDGNHIKSFAAGDQGNGVITYPVKNANGGIMTSNGEVNLAKYARGGIARSPQLALFGEGSTPEAYVPLPDGRSIPVTINQGSEIGGGSGVTNNIVINVSATSGGGVGEQKNTSIDNSESAEFSQKLGQRIKAVVVQEIAQQSRPGGLLYQSK